MRRRIGVERLVRPAVMAPVALLVALEALGPGPQRAGDRLLVDRRGLALRPVGPGAAGPHLADKEMIGHVAPFRADAAYSAASSAPRMVAKSAFRIWACTPLVRSTTCEMLKSVAALR